MFALNRSKAKKSAQSHIQRKQRREEESKTQEGATQSIRAHRFGKYIWIYGGESKVYFNEHKYDKKLNFREAWTGINYVEL